MPIFEERKGIKDRTYKRGRQSRREGRGKTLTTMPHHGFVFLRSKEGVRTGNVEYNQNEKNSGMETLGKGLLGKKGFADDGRA